MSGREDVGTPGVWDETDVVVFHHVRDPPGCGQTAAAGEIGLDNIDPAALDQVAESPVRPFLFSRGNWSFYGIG